MSEYQIGYCKPPKSRQFKPGICPNPRGRGAGIKKDKLRVMQEELYALVSYRENGRQKKAARIEVHLKRISIQAMKGDVAAAAELLRWRKFVMRTESQSHTVTFTGGIADMYDLPGVPNSSLDARGLLDSELPSPFDEV